MNNDDATIGKKVHHPLGFDGMIVGYYFTKEYALWNALPEKQKAKEEKPECIEAVSVGTIAFGKYEEYRMFPELLEEIV